MIEEAKVLARQAKELSQQAVDLNQHGKYVEGYRLMQQAFWLLEEKLAS